MQEDITLQKQITTFIRAFGLHKPDQTPCGKQVTVAEVYSLMELTHEGTLTQNDLVVRLQLAKSTVSRLVKRLVRRGWVQQTPNPQDRRCMNLSLTEEGQSIAADLAQARQQKFSRLLSRIPRGKQPLVFESLDILIEALHNSCQDEAAWEIENGRVAELVR